MPLYEYRCERCRKKTEVLQSYSEKPLKVCPHCGKPGLKKLLSAPAIQFKGTGWYVTDYAGKKGSGSESSKESGEGANAKSETKEKSTEKSGKSEKKKTKKES